MTHSLGGAAALPLEQAHLGGPGAPESAPESAVKSTLLALLCCQILMALRALALGSLSRHVSLSLEVKLVRLDVFAAQDAIARLALSGPLAHRASATLRPAQC